MKRKNKYKIDFIEQFMQLDNEALNKACEEATKIKRLPRKIKKYLREENE